MWLARQFFSRIGPNTKVLLVGDADQLQSVGAGDVFRELIDCGLIPVTVLNEIFRQKKDSLIAYNAQKINNNDTGFFYGNDFTVCKCSQPGGSRRTPAESLSGTGEAIRCRPRGRSYRPSAPPARPPLTNSTRRSGIW